MATLILIGKSPHSSIQLTNSSKMLLRRFISSEGAKHYDIVIAGGGMVGSTLACTLGKNPRLENKSILLLEGSKSKQWKLPEKYSNRVVSVNPGTRKLLKDIGAWNFIEKCRFTTVKRLQVWDGISDASITFGEAELTEDVSYIVENDVLVAAVLDEIKNTKNVQVQYEAKIKGYELPQYSKNNVKVLMENGREISCDLLIGSDGVKSMVRSSMQADYVSWNYNQMGVVATLKLAEKIKNQIAWQRFLPTGPVALLPLTDDQSSLVWSTTPEQAKMLLSLSEEEFVDELNRAIWRKYHTSNVVQQASDSFDNLLRFFNWGGDTARQYPPKICGIEDGSRAAFPLGFGHSSQYIGKGVALIGDAAHRVHPLAGQGVNLGFGDVACLNSVLGQANTAGTKIYDLNYLKDYEKQRQLHNVPTMLAIEGLHRLYNTDLAPLVILRSLGLQATHALDPLKKVIISRAAV